MAVKQEHSDDSYIQGTQFKLPRKILDAELEAIRYRRQVVRCGSTAEAGDRGDSSTEGNESAIENKLVGLALSGGGIRSATFSLGVIQRLAKEGCLKHVDYLSTVSGGGFIGGSLTWLLSSAATALNSGNALGTTSTDLPYGVEDPRKERLRKQHTNILKHLRLHGKYLTPGKCITLESLIAVVLRGILINFVVWLPLVTAIMVGLRRVPSAFDLLLYVTAILFLGCSLVYGLVRKTYLKRRTVEQWIRYPFRLGLLFLALGSLPWVEQVVFGYIHHVGLGTLLLGVVGGLTSFASSKKSGDGTIPLRVLAPIASILLIYGLLLISYALSVSYCAYDPSWSNWALGGALAVSVMTGLCANLNYISFHKYYRDRLMEAFMPHPRTTGKCCDAKDANKAELSTMCSKNAPYHLVNTNVVLVDSDDPRWKVRGGDAFLLSPKYCGSSATGWVRTACYMKKDPLTLPTAVAISGAAANPNTAAGGTGPTRNPAVSLLMALLNIRLGYWVSHPRKYKSHHVINHFRAAWRELSSNGYEENQKVLQLSDGAHFENLGVYELVRRKVKLIICCDGSADPEFKFTDLQTLVRRIGSDLGARIVFKYDNQLERIIPSAQQHVSYPAGVKYAEQGYIQGKIVYSDNTEGILILLKTTMIRDVGLLLKGYKGANPVFPDQSTADQFFDEEQFEAYRELGYEIAKQMIHGVSLKALLRQCL